MRVLDISDGFETASSPTAETHHIKLSDDGISAGAQGSNVGLFLESSTSAFMAFQNPTNNFSGLYWSENTDVDGAEFKYRWTGTAATSSFIFAANSNTTVFQMFTNGEFHLGDGANQPKVELNNASGGGAYIGAVQGNGNMQIFAGPGTGSYFRIYGPSHSSLAQDVQVNEGSNNLYYYDHSANTIVYGKSATVHTFTGKVNASNAGFRTIVATDNISTASTPTDAELDTAFGTPATVGSGFVGILDDNDAGTDVHICFTDGSAWFFVQGTLAS